LVVVEDLRAPEEFQTNPRGVEAQQATHRHLKRLEGFRRTLVGLKHRCAGDDR